MTAGATEVTAQPAHTTAAESVFLEGRALMAEGRFAEACPKFELSARLERAAGTEANLAECYLRLGRTASAWLHYREAAALAQHSGASARAAEARERAARLEPSLCRLVVRAQQPLPPGTILRRDGEPLDLALLDKGVPVDPGQHVIEGRVREARAVSRSVSIPAPEEGAPCVETVVVLPSLPSPPPPKPPARPTERASSGGPGKVLPLVLGGAGLVGLGIGAGFVVHAVAKRDGADCTSAGCSSAALGEWRSAGTSADIATVSLAAGGVLTGAAVVLWLMAPGSKRSVARAAAP
jgi:hypothetical protein